MPVPQKGFRAVQNQYLIRYKLRPVQDESDLVTNSQRRTGTKDAANVRGIISSRDFRLDIIVLIYLFNREINLCVI